MIKKTAYILNVLFLTFVFGSLAFADDDEELIPKLQVTGKGEVMVKPDTAFITLAVETTALTASEAAQQNANKMQSVLKAVKSIIGKEDKVTTARYDLSPRYEYNKTTKKSELTGYTASNSINVETKRINKLGQIIDKSISAGANRVGSVNFGASAQESFRKEALAKAVKDARNTADIVSAAAGVKIVRILNISPSYHYPIPQRRDFAVTSMERAAPTPIEAGELSITANVNMVFEIE